MKITVVGGAGGMGRFFCRFFASKGWEVLLVDLDPRAPEIATELGVGYESSGLRAVKESDGVLVSVPIPAAPEAIGSLAPSLRPGSFLMDVTSVKRGPVDAMKASAPAEAEVIGTHPLFGPTARGLEGQTIILTPVGRGKWFQKIQELFESAGARCPVMTPEEHDRWMAVIQGLTHFTQLAFGLTLRRLGFDVERAREFMSPSYEVSVDLAGRILAQNPKLYFAIQRGLDTEPVQRAFLEEVEGLMKRVRQGDEEGFAREFVAAREHFRKSQEALQRTDELIARYRKR
ncbi:MAG: prephenate dehydrogenase/arogenate dehydrogenase family protein [Halobacteria archaeon]